ASCAPTCAVPSLSKPCDEIVADGSDIVHCPFTSGKTSLSVFCSSTPVISRKNGRPSDGPEQSRWKFGSPDEPAVPVPVLPAGAAPAVPGLPQLHAPPVADGRADPGEPPVPVGLSTEPAPAHADTSASAPSDAS